MFSDVGPMELLTLAVLGVLLFGPDKLPEVIQNVAGFLRKVRAFSDSAKEEIRSELGPEFKDFEFEDLHPKTLVRKHVLGGDAADSIGLSEIRSALDPRKELEEVADAVREAADPVPDLDVPSSSALAAAASSRVTLVKDADTAGSPRPVYDEAT